MINVRKAPPLPLSLPPLIEHSLLGSMQRYLFYLIINSHSIVQMRKNLIWRTDITYYMSGLRNKARSILIWKYKSCPLCFPPSERKWIQREHSSKMKIIFESKWKIYTGPDAKEGYLVLATGRCIPKFTHPKHWVLA